MDEPIRVSVRMYQVGFGDCFLVSFAYEKKIDGRDERHLLVDFGRNTRPRLGGDMKTVAQSIAQRCGGKLDVVVISHRHEDHLSAFGSKAVGSIIAGLSPDLVARSWTEDPALPADAQGLVASGSPGARYLAGLSAAQALAAAIDSGDFPASGTKAGRALRKAAADQISNKAAIDRLNALSAGGRGVYLRFGDASGIEQLIPGISVSVLGPPTPQQWPAVANQREDDPEYWLSMTALLGPAIGLTAREAGEGVGVEAGAVDDEGDGAEAADLAEVVELGPARWLVERIRRQQVGSTLRIVRWLDRSLNNTSLILLIRAGSRRLLFPGDAQIENWQYALAAAPGHEAILAELARVDLYKVGHHGSRNATPKSLYGLWHPAEGAGAMVRPVRSLMSTRDEVYGEKDGTKVPSGKLITALRKDGMQLWTTLQPPEGPAFVEMIADTSGDAGFEPVGAAAIPAGIGGSP